MHDSPGTWPWRASSPIPYEYRNVSIVGGGFITGIVMHPAEPGLMYARTDVGGAYRHHAGAERWIPITDFIGQDDWRYTGVESLAVDPSDPERVYLALGIYNRPEIGPGAIARSRNRGASWEILAMPFGMGGNEAGRGSGERLAVDPNAGNVVYFGSRDAGLFVSRDFGASFRRVEGFPEVETAFATQPPPGRPALSRAIGIVFVLFDPSSSGSGGESRTIYAGVSTREASLFRSEDGGESWQAVPGQPRGLRPIRAVRAANGVLYLTYGSEPGPNTMHEGAVWRFDPAAGAWTEITPLAPEPDRGQTFGYAGIAVDAADPDKLLVATAFRDHAPGSGGDELFRSTDGGASFHAIGQASERDWTRAPWLAFGRGHVHVGHWMYALAIDPFDGDRAYYGTGQTIWGTAELSAADRGERCAWRVCALGIEETVPLALASPPRGPELWVGVGDISGFSVFDVADPARKHHFLDPTFQNTTGIDFAEHDPDLVVRVGTRGWDRERDRDAGAFSENGGRTWRAFAASPDASAAGGDVAVAADGASVIWTPRGLAPHVSRDRGRSWARAAGLPDRAVRIVADRADARVFYALERDGGALFRSEDGGRSFERAGELPGAPLADVCAEPGRQGRIWAIVGRALLRSADGGRSFAVLPGPSVTHVGVGRAAPSGDGSPTLYVVGHIDGVEGFHRSVDQGRHFERINDARTRFGQIRAICGDPKRFGRVYIATGGRGVIYGDQSAIVA